MKWQEFKDMVDEELKNNGLSSATEVIYIDFNEEPDSIDVSPLGILIN